jgi:imidazolonepropionase
MTLLVQNIGRLAGVHNPEYPLRGSALAEIPSLDNAWLLIEDGIISGYGSMNDADIPKTDKTFNASGRLILPAWVDSHTHIVFAASREDEFVDKIRGLNYAEIAAKGGGILNSAARLNDMSEGQLLNLAWERLEKVQRMGTGAIEIKSGYGLTVEGELKMLRVIKRLKDQSSMLIKATFLGAHSYPAAYKDDHEGYLQLIENEILPVIAKENLADFIDVFCETGFFSPEETERVCRAGIRIGLKAKIHANQLNLSGGVETGVKIGALSVDHLETMNEETIRLLASSSTIGTLLPTAAFFLRMPYQPARQLIDQGCAIALASDFNPGSSPSGNMNLVVAMASIGMRMLPEESINAATINGAFAMDLADQIGSISIGKKAILNIAAKGVNIATIPYRFGEQQVQPLNREIHI